MYRSIFVKISTIFLLLGLILLFLSIETMSSSEELLAELRIKRYLQITRDIKKEIKYDDLTDLSEDLHENGLQLIQMGQNMTFNPAQFNYLTRITRNDSVIDIYVDEHNAIYLNLTISGIPVVLKDTQEIPFFRQNGLKILFFSVMVAFFGLYMMILRLFLPIRQLQRDMEQFGSGNLHSRSSIIGEDEIGSLAREFNRSADTVQNLIDQKNQLVLDISHEIRTPITKGKLSLALIPDSKYKENLKKAFNQIDILTDTLLSSNGICKEELQLEELSLGQIIQQAIENVLLSDSEATTCDINDDMIIKADQTLITLVVKNIIDNALKYATNHRAFIRLEKGTLYISNEGDKLSKELSYYLQPFTKEDNSRGTKGYGLGLNIVDRIVKAHGLELCYRHNEGLNTFYINFYKIQVSKEN